MEYSRVRENFEKHGFSTRLFPNRADAVGYLAGVLEKRSIGFGGSATLQEIGLFEALEKKNAVVWHNKVPALEVRYLANQARVYITSANAVTEAGEIVNIDFTGNRAAMTLFGPELCYYVVGKNKIVGDLAAAIDRCRNIAAPRNAQRLKTPTPCALKGDKCYDCNSPGRICSATVIHHRAPRGMRCEMIFIDEELGY